MRAFVRAADGRVVTEEEALRNGTLRDGYTLRSGSITLMDGALRDSRAVYQQRVSNAWRGTTPTSDATPTATPTGNFYDAYDVRLSDAWRAA